MPVSHNLFELFASRFADTYYEPFLTIPLGPSVSYADVDRRSAAIAAVLVEGGAVAGDRVVAQVEKSIDAVALYWACLRTGLVYVPLNTAYTAEEVGYFLGDAEPAAFVFTPERTESLVAVGDIVGVPSMYTLGVYGEGSLAELADETAGLKMVVPRQADDLACILYTSGTTGRSKGAMLTHANLASNGIALHRIWRFAEGDVLLHCLPIFHVHGLFVALHCAILNGSEVRFLPRFDPMTVIDELPHSTVMMGVPTQYGRLLAEPEFTPDVTAGMRLFTCGSAPLTQPVFQEFQHRTGHTICERYGMTECGIITSNALEGPRSAGTVGYPLPKVEVRVVADTGTPVDDGEVGVLEVKGPNVFAGYWQSLSKTEEVMTPDGYFHTGDIATMGADGRVTLIGRVSDMIISGGLNVYPKEVEVLIDDVDGVDECAVVGLPHPDLGEGVTAFVVVDPKSGLDEDLVREAIVTRIASFKQPKLYFFVEELPRNAMGKVQKSVLRNEHSAAFEFHDL
ncbi:MAG: AMP-binding protein [Acidimicrobiales bacterium]